MECEVADPEGSGDPRRPLDGGGNVVELQVQEHLVAQLGQRADGLRPGCDEQLESDLGHAEPRSYIARDAQGGDQIVDVEGDRQLVAEVALAVPLTHGPLLAGLARVSPDGAGTSVRARPPLAAAPGVRRT